MKEHTKKELQKKFVEALREQNEIDKNEEKNKIVIKNIKNPTEEERQKQLDELNRIARKPENVKKLVDFLKITGQIPGITPEEEKEYWENIKTEQKNLIQKIKTIQNNK